MTSDAVWPADLTVLLHRAGRGDRDAADELVPLIYQHLRQMARRQLRGQADQVLLSTTVLVHEAWLSLMGGDREAIHWADRGHFYRYASRAMRSILIDHVRAMQSGKRGGGAIHVEFAEQAGLPPIDADDLLALDSALEQLSAINPRLGEVVVLRFYGGLEVEEAAQALGVHPRTVVRDWCKARLMLQGLIEDPGIE